MRPAAIILLVLATQAPEMAHSADVDVPRVKAAIATFLNVSPAKVQWPPIAAPDGVPNWFHPIMVWLPDPPTSKWQDESHAIMLGVNPRDYYVQKATWRGNWPPDSPKCPGQLSVDECVATASRFAHGKLKPWPKDMRLEYKGVAFEGPLNPIYAFRWEEWDGPARTGTRVTVSINPCPPARVYSFSQYIAPPFSVSAVKVSQEKAVAAACDEVRRLGAANPRLKEARLYLAEPELERPHWRIVLDYDNRNGGFLPEIFIDAVTGNILQPER